MMKRIVVTALASALVAALGAVSPGGAAETKLRVLQRAVAAGNQASAGTQARAARPARLVLRVLANPWQRAKVQWRVACANFSAERERAGRFSTRAPLTRTLPVTVRQAHACSISARATLAHKGRVTVLLLKSP